MSLDRTLKLSSELSGSRSVLSRAERIAKLTTEGKFDPETDSPMGLPKVKVRHSRAGTKSKKEAPTEEAAEGEATEEAQE
jgi:small basic protein (TIGR04137 family)